MKPRFRLLHLHGEGKSFWHIIDTRASHNDGDPAIIPTPKPFTSYRDAEHWLDLLNKAQELQDKKENPFGQIKR